MNLNINPIDRKWLLSIGAELSEARPTAFGDYTVSEFHIVRLYRDIIGKIYSLDHRYYVDYTITIQRKPAVRLRVHSIDDKLVTVLPVLVYITKPDKVLRRLHTNFGACIVPITRISRH